MKSQLILSQATDALLETNATRRAIDGKIHSLLVLTLALPGLLVALKIWTSLRLVGQSLFVAALIIYVGVIGIGLLATYPKVLHIPSARAIFDFQSEADYDDLVKWVIEDILDLIDDNARIIRTKSSSLGIMAILVGFATVALVISVLV